MKQDTSSDNISPPHKKKPNENVTNEEYKAHSNQKQNTANNFRNYKVNQYNNKKDSQITTVTSSTTLNVSQLKAKESDKKASWGNVAIKNLQKEQDKQHGSPANNQVKQPYNHGDESKTQTTKYNNQSE